MTAPDTSPARPGAGASEPTEVPARGWWQILRRAWREQGQDNVSILAGAVAYFSFLSIFPALIAAISIWGIAADPGTVVSQAESFLSQLPDDASSIVTDQLESVASGASGALSLGVAVTIVLALWSASGGMGTMIKAINIAYDETDERGLVRGRALSLALTIGAIAFVLLALGLVAVLPAVLGVVDLGPVTRFLVLVGRWVVLAAAILVALAILYRVAPDRDDAKFRWVSAGALVAAVGWLLASAGFSLYVSNFGSYNETYGAVAGAAILLLWLYLSAFIVLMGAEINAEAERQTRRDTTRGEERPRGQRNAVAADTEPGQDNVAGETSDTSRGGRA